MTSFIVVSTNKNKRDEYIAHFCDEKQIDTFDRTNLTLETSVKQNTQSIGIEDIKQMQKKIFLKPIKSEMKAVIVDDAQLLTHEAQNALLKVLEEPPAHTMLFLSTDSKETLLPTILSRCHIVELETVGTKLTDKELADYNDFIERLNNLSVGERLKKAEMLAKDKDKAIIWIGKLILVLREKLLESSNNETASNASDAMQQFSNRIKSFQALHTLLKTTNVNPRFAIENTLFLQ